MGFGQFDIRHGHIPWEYLKADALTLEIGTALVMTDGLLTLATGTTKPTYFSQYVGATTNGQVIPVTRVDAEQKYETVLSVASEDIEVGEKYTIDATGNKLTATAEGGVAEVVAFEGTAAGDKVLVRFP